MPSDLRFSVVVPTRDRPAALARCLQALDAQQLAGEYEVVVVDDGSRAADAVARVVSASAHGRLVRVERGGSAAARNRGVREARAPVVLLLDDDCEPRPDWGDRLAAAVENGASVAAGRCVNAQPDDVLADATQTILHYLTVASARGDGTVRFAPTYNIACRRELALSVPFEESYVNQGADRDWCARLESLGHAIAFEPGALADHRQQLDLGAFWRKHMEYGRGSARFRRRHGLSLGRPRFYLGLLGAGFRRGVRIGLAVCLAQVAAAGGAARHALARRS